MKRTAAAPGGVAVAEEPWDAVTDRTMREAANAALAERNEAQRASEERLRRLAAVIGAYWLEFQREWRRVGEGPLGEVLGPSLRGGGDRPQVVAGVGGCELIGARGRVSIKLDDDGSLFVSRRVFGSGYDTELTLEPDGAGGITPSPADVVQQILEPLVRQLGRIA
jgi:hypothetical protein